MQDIKKREEKMKEKRKQTTWRDFVKQQASWMSLSSYRWDVFNSRYPKNDRIGWIISVREFEDGRDELIKKWLPYDFGQSFFDNYQKLLKSICFPNKMHFGKSENCEYGDVVKDSRNIYLTNTVGYSESVLYSFNIKDSNNVFNSMMVFDNCDLIYMTAWVVKSFKIFYSKYIVNSSNIRFSTNLNWCSECIFCDDLENKSYCIKNAQYSKENYLREKGKILHDKDLFLSAYRQLNAKWKNIWSTNVKWEFVLYSEDIENGYFSYQVKNGRNVFLVWGNWVNENLLDVINAWADSNANLYGVMWSWWGSNKIFLSMRIIGQNIYYSYFLDNCSYCLGCVGLKNKSFCIFNKEYSKEERFELANKIFEQMDKDWMLWDFFPWWMNPFYFNDTVAYLIDDSFTKEEVAKQWYLRRDEEIKVNIPAWAEIVEIKDLKNYQWFENWVWKIDPEILKKVIKDEKGNYYRIVKMEYDFLMKHGLPLPELHWLERIKLGFRFK